MIEYDVYLSGPMTGCVDWNRSEFERAAGYLRKEGFVVCNPHELTEITADKSWSDYMRVDLQHLCKSRGIVTLRGYMSSAGALLEVGVARALGMPMMEFDEVVRLGRGVFMDLAG